MIKEFMHGSFSIPLRVDIINPLQITGSRLAVLLVQTARNFYNQQKIKFLVFIVPA